MIIVIVHVVIYTGVLYVCCPDVVRRCANGTHQPSRHKISKKSTADARRRLDAIVM